MNKLTLSLFVISCFIFSSANAQTCSNELESQLEKMPDILKMPRPIDSSVDLDVRCISASMDTFFNWTNNLRIEREEKNEESIGHYGYCESSDQKKVTRLHTPPCQSDTYLAVIQNSYNDVLKCFNLDPKKIFAITAVESGFHINTFSLTSQDIGIGQLIPAAIAEVNAFWEDSLAELKQSDNPACQNLQPLLTDLKNAPSEGSRQACSMMALPENPVRNLLYLGMLHKFHEQKMSRYFKQTRMSERLKEFTGEEWTESELENLKEVLVFLSYNAGAQGARDIFESFIAEKQSTRINWNDEYTVLYQSYIDYYLRAMDLKSNGSLIEAESLLLERKNTYVQMTKLKEAQQASAVSKSIFFANTNPGSFGEYLLNNKKSEYLKILLGRIDYIENTMLKSPGLCANPGFLIGQ